MKKTLVILSIAILVLVGVVLVSGDENETPSESPDARVEVVVENLSIPWDIAFLPDGSFLVTEREGTLLHIEDGTRREVAVSGTAAEGEGGLLGVLLHPEFSSNRFVYLYQTTRVDGGLRNRVVRYEFNQGSLINEREIIANIPGAPYHDGGRMEFGPEGYLFITTGDATQEALAQDTSSLAGKILRLHDDGTIPTDNPFGNAVWSYGHRNPQGLAWDSGGRLWSTEHGRSGARSGFDEVNLITRGANYGWPESEGDTVETNTMAPVIHSGARRTWAPASALVHGDSLFFGGLRGETLYEAILAGSDVVEVREHFSGEFGRIRTVVEGPDGMLYLTTSNTDGRGYVREGDDKVIRIDPTRL